MDYDNDPELQEILKNLENLSDADLEKTINCGGDQFKVKDAYFI